MTNLSFFVFAFGPAFGMNPQVDVNPRKFPRQARARATVEAIIVATAQLLTEEGFEALTTARVAERAGVSVGSLYQYFPNKRALAAAVVDHHSEKLVAAFDAAWQSHDTLAAAVDSMIRAALVTHPHRPELHRALNELAPRVGRAEKAQQISARIAGLIETVLARHRHELAPDLEPADAAALIETVLETVSHRAIQDHPASIPDEKAVIQCRRLILAYLTSPCIGVG
ncbi:AcrR family transcriptional regulator [Pseudorhizobium tarimense]|uniref:AcrR family transcriptional regulator n=1 Tax=Pseudorhizobium tarimense TaxID=1079109 RepID=A0ABV2H6C2_9HYPH|nr:TetR/AcrR family transcriptional regulator [Pseudorhizobium tarimense]MCJ8519082.1 TetR/AcrR family transcriptional regulator [Pseudorhizobium tarimense]